MEERPVFVTSDGDEIAVRPITPDDAPALVDFHEHLSAETVYLRFFSSHTHLRPAEVERFTHVDGHNRFAVVAEHEGGMVAVARYDRLADPATAEVAFVVADAWQHHGIGGFLLRVLADAAEANGISELVAEVLMGNRTMLAVFSESGLPMRHREADGTVEVRLSLEPARDGD